MALAERERERERERKRILEVALPQVCFLISSISQLFTVLRL
jgi:hypothetical protein